MKRQGRFRLGICALVAVAALAVAETAGAKAKWVVSGGGYGHGVGMSAYGAFGFGKNGFSYKQILTHYYKGTKVDKLRKSRAVRVLLDVKSSDVKFTRARKACGRDLKTNKTYRAHRSGSDVELQTAGGKTIRNCGKRLRAAGKGRINIKGVGVYRGALDAVPGSGDSLNVVNKVDFNDYAKGVLPVEIFPDWPKETLKTFAVAARSIGITTDVGGDGFDLYQDTRTQNYGGYAVETKRTNRAVRETENRVLEYKGKVAQTTYFSASGGRTESGFLGAPEVPYLKSVKDPYDHFSPLHRWKFTFTRAEMTAKLSAYLNGGKFREVKVLQRGDSPRIDYARVVGTRGGTKVRGDSLASALGLYDRWAYFKKKK